MSAQRQHPYRKPGMQRLMRWINVPMRLALRLPFRTPLNQQLMLLRFTGRKSGKTYRQPVSYIPDGETLLTPGGGTWKRNLREDRAITIWLRGRKVAARPEFVRDPVEVVRLLSKMMDANPRVTAFVPVMGADGQVDRDKLDNAIRYGFCIIRWHLDGVASQQLLGAASR